MNTRKVLYTCAGVFNCVIGGIGCFFGLMMLLISGLIRKMFESSTEIVDEFVSSLASESSKYEYLLTASNEEILSFIMKIVFIVCAVLLILGLVWITFGVFNIKLSKRHYIFFGRRPKLKLWFVIGSWVLLLLNPANIATTVAVYLKNKNGVEIDATLYSSSDES